MSTGSSSRATSATPSSTGARGRSARRRRASCTPTSAAASHEGLLAVYSLSKQSNLAGYRAAFVAGDPALVGAILEVRKHAGMIMPTPVQHAMAVALRDDTHVQTQRTAYARRRELLLAAVARAGLRVDHSEAGLYLWATREEDCWTTVSELADRGILVAPGSFYGAAGQPARAHRAHGDRRAHRGRLLPALTAGRPAPARPHPRAVVRGGPVFSADPTLG